MNGKNYLKIFIFKIITIAIICFSIISCSQNKSNLDLHKLIDLKSSFYYPEMQHDFDKQIANANNIEHLLNLYTERGFYHLRELNYKEAKSDFNFVLKKDENHIGAISGMIEYLTKNIGVRYDSSWQITSYDTSIVDSLNFYINKRLTLVQDDISYYYKVRITHDFESKLNSINNAIKINPNFYLAYEIKSTICQLFGKDELAVDVLDTLLTKDIKKNRKENIYYMRLDINKRMKNYDEAIKDIYNIAQLSATPEYAQTFEEILISEELNDRKKIQELEEKLEEFKKNNQK